MIKDIIQKISIKVIYNGLVASIVPSEAICKSQLNNERGIYTTPNTMLNALLIFSIFCIFYS